MSLLRDRDPAVRNESAQALERIAVWQGQLEHRGSISYRHDADQRVDFQAAIAPLFAALEDDDAVRDSAARALAAALRFERLTEPLLRMLASPSPSARMAAVRALGDLMSTSHVSQLVRATTDQDAGVRAEALWALGRLYPPNPIRTYHDTGWVIQTSHSTRRRKTPASVERALQHSLHDSDQNVRIRAAWAAGISRAEWKYADLLQALGDEHEEVRRTSAGFLMDAAPPESADVIDYLTPAVDSPDIVVRRAAVYALSRQRDERAFEPLWRAFCDKELCDAATSGLAWLRCHQSARVLVAALCDESRHPWLSKAARRALARLLREFSHPTTVEAIMELIEAAAPARRRSLLATLDALGVSHETATAINALNAGEAATRRRSVWLLRGESRWKREALREALADDDVQVRYLAAFALARLEDIPTQDLVSALRDEHWEVRSAAIRELAERSDFDAVVRLKSLLADKSASVRAATVHAMTHRADSRQLLLLLPLLNDSHEGVAQAVIDAMAITGSPSKSEIVPTLRKRRAWLRCALAWEAGKLQSDEVLDWLMEALPRSERTCATWMSELLGQADELGFGWGGKLASLDARVREQILDVYGGRQAEEYARGYTDD